MRQVVCPECGKTFDGEYGLSFHRKNEHGVEPPPAPSLSLSQPRASRILLVAGIIDIIAINGASSYLLSSGQWPVLIFLSVGVLVAGGIAWLYGDIWLLVYWGSCVTAAIFGSWPLIAVFFATILTVISRSDWSKWRRVVMVVVTLVVVEVLGFFWRLLYYGIVYGILGLSS